jgi:hypothetical protein
MPQDRVIVAEHIQIFSYHGEDIFTFQQRTRQQSQDWAMIISAEGYVHPFLSFPGPKSLTG